MENTKFEPIIGLEIHVQLKTKSKLFCSCSTEAAYDPRVKENTHICPICAGHPGILPMAPNQRALLLGVRIAKTLNCNINPKSLFDRKNYFYPDLPKGYQISQFFLPLATNGWIDVEENKRIQIRRIHIEEDAGKSKQEGNNWFIDMNRCGIPLAEIVTEPDIRSASEASAFVRELQLILRYIDASEANMELGNLRCDVNVSIRPVGTAHMGVKTEIKNINSFQFIEDAINWELSRQSYLISNDKAVEQVTIHWDEKKKIGQISREKVVESDYRYFREPDQLPVALDEMTLQEATRDIPVLPSERRKRYKELYNLATDDSNLLVQDRKVSDYFEETLDFFSGPPKLVHNWIFNYVLRSISEGSYSFDNFPVTPKYFGELLTMFANGELNQKLAMKAFDAIIETNKSPKEVVQELGLKILRDDKELKRIVDNAIENNPDLITACINGNPKSINALLGIIMRSSKGLVDGKTARDMLLTHLQEISK